MSHTCLTCPTGMKTMGNIHSIQPYLCPTQTHVNPPVRERESVHWDILGRGTSAGPLAFESTQRILPCYSLLSPHSLSRPNAPFLGTDGDQSLGDFSLSSHQPTRKSHKQQERRQITHQGTTSRWGQVFNSNTGDTEVSPSKHQDKETST